MSPESPYDAVPYPGRALPQTHPDRLATMAALFGLDGAAAPAACRVLELGCGDGANLLPLALALPGSSFVGVDSSGAAIARASALAARLGARNIDFVETGFEAFEHAPGEFDYVIAHGLYSWIDAPLRDRLMALFAAALSERGVAYVSYNALPGHAIRQTLRDMLAFALEGNDEPRERMAAARELLTETTELWGPGDGSEATIGGHARMLLEQGDALFFHDTLAPVNKALYVRELAAHAAAHGLQFLAEADFHEMQTGGLPEGLQHRVRAVEDPVAREQLIDFLKQRMFRQTLLCRAAVALDRTPSLQRIARLAASGQIDAVPEEGSERVTFGGSGAAKVTTDHPLLLEALRRIGAAWPGAVWLEDLAGGDAGTLRFLCEALLGCFAANLVRLHVHPPALATVQGKRPLAPDS